MRHGRQNDRNISIFTVSIGHNWPKWVNILLQLPAILESLLEFLYYALKAESEAQVYSAAGYKSNFQGYQKVLPRIRKKKTKKIKKTTAMLHR